MARKKISDDEKKETVKAKTTKKEAKKEEKPKKEIKAKTVKKETKKEPVKKETRKKVTKEEKKPEKVVKEKKTKKETKTNLVKEEKVVKEKASKKKVKESLLNKNNQKTLKILSRIISVIAKILKVCAMIIVPIIAVVAILMPIIFNQIEFDGNIIKFSDIRMVINEDNITASIGDKTYLLSDNLTNTDKIINFLNDGTVLNVMISLEMVLIFSVIIVIINIYIFGYVAKLFDNFYKGKTPFTSENSDYIHRIGKTMIISLIATFIFEIVLVIFTKNTVECNFKSYSILGIMVIYVIYYIFMYATKLQEKTTDSIYD